MDLANRIQSLRKARGISQEELADKAGVSRQAVSKWESGQSTPDLEKILILSEYFGVTTDSLLKGIEQEKSGEEQSNALISRILYIASTAFLAIGLLSAFAGWHQEQTADNIWGAMIIQVVGAAAYFIGRLISPSKPALAIDWLNIIVAALMPISLIVTSIVDGAIAPYPTSILSGVVFAVVYAATIALSMVALKKRRAALENGGRKA